MHKPFYASGFIYHSPSQQILLQQFENGNDAKLVLFRGKNTNGENPETVFQKCVEKALGTTIPTSSIHPVYDYVHDKLGEHFIFYVEISEAAPAAYKSKNASTWCPLAKLSKYSMSEQTRHDIIVGVRVITSLVEAANPTPPRHH